MKLRGKNLFDEPEIMLQNRIFYESTKANILRIELNQFTLNKDFSVEHFPFSVICPLPPTPSLPWTPKAHLPGLR
jgi:hypothetical protein